MKSYTISIIFFNIGLLLFAPHLFVGSYVDSIGILVEPAFFCIPLGYLSFILSIFSAMYSFTRNKFYKKVIELNDQLVVFFSAIYLPTSSLSQ
ncbi:hypothetical protein IGJ48_002015 [Enterococcus pernyi]